MEKLGIVEMAMGSIGLKDRPTFGKYGETSFVIEKIGWCFAGLDGDSDLEALVNDGRAEKEDTMHGPMYHLTSPKGLDWLEDVTGIKLYGETRPEKEYNLNDSQIMCVEKIWKYVKDNHIRSRNFAEELDVKIIFDNEQLRDFKKEFQTDNGYFPFHVSFIGTFVFFSDMLDFKISGRQIWSLRPKEGMRD